MRLATFSLVNPLNPFNASVIGRVGVNADPQGIVRYVLTDKGPLFKSAGYLCGAPFNPAGGVLCPEAALGVPTNVSGNELPNSPELSYSMALNKDFISDSAITSLRLVHRFQAKRFGDVYNSTRASAVSRNSGM